ncbi:protein-lysine N-methyltransferase SMYD4 [Augochlora pura]
MFTAKGCTKFHEFFKVAYDGGMSEPFATRFRESSLNGNREGMIKVLMDIPYIKSMKVAESYRGKDDVKAAEIYSKIRGAIVKNGEQGNRTSALAETLFMASVTSRLFLEVLFDSAQSCYDSGNFSSCLRYCECMLALPASFYDRTAESMTDFVERRKACMYLASECTKMLKRSSSTRLSTNEKRVPNQTTPNESSPNEGVPTIPAVDGKRNAVLQSCSDAVALKFDKKKGRHLIATRNIKAGSILIVEPPFASTTNKEALDTNCLHCHVSLKPTGGAKIPCRSCQAVSFCSEKCRSKAWKAYHRYECLLFDAFYENRSGDMEQQQVSYLLLAYRTAIAGCLSSKFRTTNDDDPEEDEIPFLDDDFVRRHAAGANEERNRLGISEIYRSQDYRAVLALETHCATADPNVNLVRAIEAIFLTKCFTFVLGKMDVVCLEEAWLWLAVGMLHHLQAINCNAYEIVENVYNKETHIWEPREIGGAIYPSVSLVNHSCYPNVVRHSYPAGTVVVRTLRFIGKGSEILDCYGPHFLSESRLQRREQLNQKYRFFCECEACTGNWQFPLPDAIAYKCRTCSAAIGTFLLSSNDKGGRDERGGRHASSVQCCKCKEKLDRKKLHAQFRKSVGKRLNAVTRMYDGHYAQALAQLFEHIHFIEKFFIAPNIETIKTQQCIIQCYNRFGCTSQ